MLVNKYILMSLGLVISVFLGVFINIYIQCGFAILFWYWYFRLEDKKKDNEEEIE